MEKQIRIGIITSKGGHLFQLIQLKRLFQKYSRFWVADQGLDTSHFLNKERVYAGFFPVSRNLANLIRNFFLAIKIFQVERPDVLISAGAGIAVPFFVVGKLFFKTKLIFVEPYDFVRYPSLTGKIIYGHVDLFLVQHEIQKKWYPKAKNWGSLL